MTDFKMTDDFDIQFNGNGDYEFVDTIETAIPCGIFLEARDINASQGFILDKRLAARGHFGFGPLEGSRTWKLYQARLSTQTLNDARRFVDEGLRFLSVDDISNSVSVTTTSDGNSITANVVINKENTSIERQFIL